MQTPTTTMNKFRLKWWPSPQDFNEAVQIPGTTYSDADLRSGQVELTALGLPRPQTGNFASVYRIDCINKFWAVRCFLRDIPEQQSRYSHFESSLRELNLPYFVNFAYLAEGARVRGDWFPILKMEWAEGPTLSEYIGANVHEPDKLRQLAEEFKQLTIDLRSHGIAHGDLQHGNIIVSPAGLRLVDYDGMYVPQLAGQPANELGHPNYQHPARKASDFNGQLDNFSAWIIYSSLICLAEDSSLFEQLNVGDDCLLFRLKDFIQPTRSRAFALMERHPNETIKKHARWIRSLLLLSLDQIPNLSTDPIEPTGLVEINPLMSSATSGTAPSMRMSASAWGTMLVIILAIAALATWSINTAKQDTAAIEDTLKKVNPALLPANDRALISQADEYARVGQEASDWNTKVVNLQRALDIYEKYPESEVDAIVECSHQLGHDYDSENPALARQYFEKALRYLRSIGDQDRGNGSLYSRLESDLARSTRQPH